jgi:hypothetical protein
MFKLPSAFLTGVKLRKLNMQGCKVDVPYKWLSQNPFKSTYFACLAMAAELSTGAPLIWATKGHKPGIAMLVVSMESEFIKKANSVTSFVCKDVVRIFDTVKKCQETKEGETIKTESIGYNESGEIVAKFWITWSVKERSK